MVVAALRSWLPTLACVLLVGPAQAGSLPFAGSLEIRILDLEPIVIAGAGIATANGSAGGTRIDSLALAGATFSGSGTMPATDPDVFPIFGVAYDVQNQAGNFTRAGGTLGGEMPLLGVARVCLFGPCSAAVANLDIRLSVVGQDDSMLESGAVGFTVVGAPWTTGTASVASATAMGLAHGPASATSNTFAADGRLQLVTPFFFSSAIGALSLVPGFATLTIDFVPEPATLMLLVGGITLLGVIGRARRD